MKGIYLVIDPADDRGLVLKKLKQLKDENCLPTAIQIWDRPDSLEEIRSFASDLLALYPKLDVPILVNNRLELLTEFNLDGVHFDQIPVDVQGIFQMEEQTGRKILKGVTLTNDLKVAAEADKLGFDYLSFCSVFPSVTSNSCERVDLASISTCRSLTNLPIFLSGGITPDRMKHLQGLPFDGVAVVSGILHADHVVEAYQHYQQKLKQLFL